MITALTCKRQLDKDAHHAVTFTQLLDRLILSDTGVVFMPLSSVELPADMCLHITGFLFHVVDKRMLLREHFWINVLAAAILKCKGLNQSGRGNHSHTRFYSMQ